MPPAPAGAGGGGRLGGLGADGLLQHGGEVGEGRVQGADVVRGGALLRAVDGGGALGAGERVVDVAREDQVDRGEAGVEAAEVRRGELREGRAAGAHGGTGGVQEAGAERGEHAGAAVGGGAAADAEDDGGRPGVQGRAEQFTGAVRGRGQRSEHAGREELEARGLRHLDDRGGAAQGEGRRDLFTERSRDPYLAAFESGRDGRGDGAVAAVRHGQCLHRELRDDPSQSCCDPLRDLYGRERALELVGRHEHVSDLSCCSVRHLASLAFERAVAPSPTLSVPPDGVPPRIGRYFAPKWGHIGTEPREQAAQERHAPEIAADGDDPGGAAVRGGDAGAVLGAAEGAPGRPGRGPGAAPRPARAGGRGSGPGRRGDHRAGRVPSPPAAPGGEGAHGHGSAGGRSAELTGRGFGERPAAPFGAPEAGLHARGSAGRSGGAVGRCGRPGHYALRQPWGGSGWATSPVRTASSRLTARASVRCPRAM